jgi:hypothetical protein
MIRIFKKLSLIVYGRQKKKSPAMGKENNLQGSEKSTEKNEPL